MRVSAINPNYYTKSRVQKFNQHTKKTMATEPDKTKQIAFKAEGGAALGGATGAAIATGILMAIAPAATPLVILGAYFGGMIIGGKIGNDIEDNM